MPNRSITSVNSTLFLVIPRLFPAPQQIQGYAAEDIFDADTVQAAETSMGLDGILSAGFVPAPTKMSIMIQANSVSVDLFESWYSAEQQARDKYFATGILNMPSINRTYTMLNGVLLDYKPIAAAKKTLQPRPFAIMWEASIPAPL